MAERRLEALAYHCLHGPAWDRGIDFNPAAHLKARVFQKAYLARYARQSVFEWEHRPVSELNEYFEEVRGILKDEGVESRITEDR